MARYMCPLLDSQHIQQWFSRPLKHIITRFTRRVILGFIITISYAFWSQSAFSLNVLKSFSANDQPSDPSALPYPGLFNKSERTSSLNSDRASDESGHSRTTFMGESSTAPSLSSISSHPRIGKITASFGDTDPSYEDAIRSHYVHNEIHGYPHFILRERMMAGLWSKHSYLISIIGQELAKPAGKRLEWLFWHDRDTILMNPSLPLDIFIPPANFSHIHLLISNDHNGLNNGVFLLRVTGWSFKLLSSALSIREYHPEIPLKYTEQSAMEEVIKRPWWANNVAYIPQRWFNGYPPDGRPKHDVRSAVSRPGSLLIHFASNRDGLRPQRMKYWHEIARKRTKEWDRRANETRYLEEIREYWEGAEQGKDMQGIAKDLGSKIWR